MLTSALPNFEQAKVAQRSTKRHDFLALAQSIIQKGVIQSLMKVTFFFHNTSLRQASKQIHRYLVTLITLLN